MSGSSGGSDSSSYGENFATSSGFTNSSGSDMSMGGGSTTQRVYGPQEGALANKYGTADALLGYNKDKMYQSGGLIDQTTGMIGQQQDATNPAYNQQLAGGQLASAEGQQYMQGLQNTASGGNVNPYVADQKAAVARDAQSASNQMLGSLDARAAASGMSGGSRHGVAQAQGLKDINNSMLGQQANIGYQANEAERGRQMQATGMLGQGYSAMDQAQSGAVGQSGQMTDLAMAGFNPINEGWNQMGNYAGVVGPATTLSDSQNWNLGMGTNQSQAVNQSQGYGYNSSDSSDFKHSVSAPTY